MRVVQRYIQRDRRVTELPQDDKARIDHSGTKQRMITGKLIDIHVDTCIATKTITTNS